MDLAITALHRRMPKRMTSTSKLSRVRGPGFHCFAGRVAMHWLVANFRGTRYQSRPADPPIQIVRRFALGSTLRSRRRPKQSAEKVPQTFNQTEREDLTNLSSSRQFRVRLRVLENLF
jgi:hypothetical protein